MGCKLYYRLVNGILHCGSNPLILTFDTNLVGHASIRRAPWEDGVRVALNAPINRLVPVAWHGSPACEGKGSEHKKMGSRHFKDKHQMKPTKLLDACHLFSTICFSFMIRKRL